MALMVWKVLAVLLALGLMMSLATAQCTIPREFMGDWYWMGNSGEDQITIVEEENWGFLECLELKIHPNSETSIEGVNATMLMKKRSAASTCTCFVCVDVLYRTRNILQVRQGDCFTTNTGFPNLCPGYHTLPSVDETRTYFKQSMSSVNCTSTIEGMYQFTYEVSWGGGGICDNRDSQIKACHDPSSPYLDNEVFYMRYAMCPEVQTSEDKTFRYQCMGSWFAMNGSVGYTYAAIADTVEKVTRERFKCLMILKDQNNEENGIRWIMSRFADCNSLHSSYDADIRLVLRPIPSTCRTGVIVG